MSQFRVLYRQFLFRVVDPELLSASAQGDASKMLGQFAGILVFLGSLLALGALNLNTRLEPQALLAALWSMEHFLIATTMLVVGLFAVLSWDSIFLDRRDVLTLGPLPIRTRTLFLTKVAASGAGLGVTVFALNVFTGLALPFALAQVANRGVLALVFTLDFYRPLVAYWITMISAGAFIFCSVLGLQGLAAQLLSRRRFLRVSAFLQMAAFCVFLSVYFLQPSLTTPNALSSAQNQRLLPWLPSYWFLGLFQELNGSMHAALVPMARRALSGLAIAVLAASAAFLLSYFRTIRKIADEPDITPVSSGGNWLPRFRDSLQTVVVQFSIRTLVRSRQHRLILAFYLGVGFAMLILYVKSPAAQRQFVTLAGGVLGNRVNAPLLASSVLMMCLWVVGARVVFSMPLELRANWIFRVTPVRDAPACLKATRVSLFVLALAPVWTASAILFLSIWPWRPATGHLAVLAIVGVTVTELCLSGFHKVPFTCSYLPGKSQAHIVFLGAMFLTNCVDYGVRFEQRALQDPAGYARMLAMLGIVASGARWRAGESAKSQAVQFEETEPPVIFALDLRNERVLMR